MENTNIDTTNTNTNTNTNTDNTNMNQIMPLPILGITDVQQAKNEYKLLRENYINKLQLNICKKNISEDCVVLGPRSVFSTTHICKKCRYEQNKKCVKNYWDKYYNKRDAELKAKEEEDAKDLLNEKNQ